MIANLIDLDPSDTEEDPLSADPAVAYADVAEPVDPFSAEMEALVCRMVLGDRRHGLSG